MGLLLQACYSNLWTPWWSVNLYHQRPTGSREAPRGPWACVHVRGSTCSFFSRGKVQYEWFSESQGCLVWRQKTFICILCLPILSPPFQVISLRDQIKRRQQGVDGGKDVREGFMHVGSSCFCVCASVQKVRRKVDVWVSLCGSVILTLKSYLIHLLFVSATTLVNSNWLFSFTALICFHIVIIPATTQWSLLWPGG